MTVRCIMLKTKDGRKFLTSEKNLESLVEFAKTFSAELYVVESDKKPMELKSLASAICDQDFKSQSETKIVRRLYPKSISRRRQMIDNAQTIRNHILEKMENGEAISLQGLKVRFSHLGVTDACLSNHLSWTRKKLEQDGYRVEKIGAGKYTADK